MSKDKDKHLERIGAIRRVSRIEAGGPHGKAGIRADKMRRRMRRMGTGDWLEEAEEDAAIAEEVEMAVYESRLSDIECGQAEEPTVACSVCGGLVPAETAHSHRGGWIGDACCWGEFAGTTE